MTHDFEIEFEHDCNIYTSKGHVETWVEEVIGTEYNGQYEVLYTGGISHIELDELILLTEDGGADVMNDKDIKDIAKEVISDKYN